jgi:hypothetical protein
LRAQKFCRIIPTVLETPKLLFKLFRYKLSVTVRKAGVPQPAAVNESDFQPSTATLSHDPGGSTVAAAKSLLAAWEEEDRRRTASRPLTPHKPVGSKSTRH